MDANLVGQSQHHEDVILFLFLNISFIIGLKAKRIQSDLTVSPGGEPAKPNDGTRKVAVHSNVWAG